MLALLQRFGDRGLRAFGVTESATEGEERQAALDAIREEKMTFPSLLDAEGAWSKSAAIEIAPTFLVIGKDGRVAYRTTGKLTEGTEGFAKLAAALDEALRR